MEVKARGKVRVRAVAALWMGMIVLLLAPAHPALAQDAGKAGLVITTGPGETTSYCVDVAPGESLSGDAFLQRAGVTVLAEQSAMGATICSLNGTGCGFPAESCFCRCQGSPCTYWSYWRLDDAGAWQYATAGAGNTRVEAGDVEGWVWGEGTTATAKSPPALTLAEICRAPEATVAASAAETNAQTLTETLLQTQTRGSGQANAPTEAVAAAPAQSELTPVAAQSDQSAQTDGSGSRLALLGLAVLVIVPVAALLLLRRRKEM